MTVVTAADGRPAGHPVHRSRRDGLVNALFFLLGLIFTLFTFIDGKDHGLAAGPLTADAGLGVLACLLLWWRRRWPAAIAVIIGLFSVYSVSASGVALLALFSLAVHCRFTVVAPVVAGYGAASFATLAVRPDISMPPGTQVLLGIVCITAVLAWGMFVRARRRLGQSLRDEQELRVTQARQAERHRIAREMHDVLAHRISLLSLHAGALELRPDAPPADIARAAAVIRENAHLVLEDLREVIGVLRADTDTGPGTPERPQPTLAALPALIAEAQAAGASITFVIGIDDLTAVPAAAGRSAYRIIQEGLTNARKHAPGMPATITVHGAPGQGLSIEVRNPLPASTSGIPGTGTGLIGLAERASLAGGRLDYGPTPDGTFTLKAWLPWLS